jgi:fructose 1,6-bisphosphatase
MPLQSKRGRRSRLTGPKRRSNYHYHVAGCCQTSVQKLTAQQAPIRVKAISLFASIRVHSRFGPFSPFHLPQSGVAGFALPAAVQKASSLTIDRPQKAVQTTTTTSRFVVKHLRKS